MATNPFFSGASSGTSLLGGSTKAAGTLSAPTTRTYDIQKPMADAVRTATSFQVGAPVYSAPRAPAPTAPAPVAPQTFSDGHGGVFYSQAAAAASAAAIAQKEAQDKWRRGAEVKQTGYFNSADNTLDNQRNTYRNNSNNFVGDIRAGQRGITMGRTNNALNLRRSMAGIASGVRQGLRSGAVELANMNALDSSASDAMARAYSRQGNSQAASANNEAQLKENEFTVEQQNLDMKEKQQFANLKGWRANAVDTVADKLWQQLKELDLSGEEVDVNGFANFDKRKAIIANANSEMDQIDAATRRELAKINPLSQAQVLAEAAKMDAQGALATPFTVEDGTVGFSGNQPQAGGAPVSQFSAGPNMRGDDETINPFNPLLARPDEQALV